MTKTDPTPDMFIDAADGPTVTLDEYIARLQAVRDVYGGALKVQRWVPSKGRHNAPLPAIAYPVMRDVGRAVLLPQFWQEGFDAESAKGPAVVRV